MAAQLWFDSTLDTVGLVTGRASGCEKNLCYLFPNVLFLNR